MAFESYGKRKCHSPLYNRIKASNRLKYRSGLCSGSVKYINQKSNLHYTRRITSNRVTSGGVHLRGLAPGQHSSEETSQRWRVVGDTVSCVDLTGPGIEPQTYRTDSVRLATELTAGSAKYVFSGLPPVQVFRSLILQI